MSYILDALQRADAERARGQVPNLHARQVGATASQTLPGARKHLWPAIVTALALGALAGGLWVWRTSGVSGPALDTQPVEAIRTPPPATAAATDSAPVPVPPATVALSTEPMVPPATMAAASPVSVSAASSPATVAPIGPAAAGTPSARVASPAKALPVASTAAPKAPASRSDAQTKPTTQTAQAQAPMATQAPLMAELPEALRKQIPALTITGAVYSDNPAQRLLLVNGQVLAQGSLVAPDVTLVEIHSGSSEFSFRGTRFRMPH